MLATGTRVIQTPEGIRRWGNQSLGSVGTVTKTYSPISNSDLHVCVTWDEGGRFWYTVPPDVVLSATVKEEELYY